MSEYFYFKGVVKPVTSELEKVYKDLVSTEYIMDNDKLVKIEGDVISIDTVGVFASVPLSLLEEFKDKLKEIQSMLASESVIEHYVETGFGNSYNHIHLVPNSSDLKIEKISEKDPYTNKVTNEEVLDLLKQDYLEAEKVLRRYHEVVLEKLLAGKEVGSDIGSYKLELIERPSREMRNPQTGEIIMSKPKTAKNIKISNAKAEWVTKMLYSLE